MPNCLILKILSSFRTDTILKRIVKKIRERFPKVMIIFSADSHHSKPEVHEWCESHKVEFIIGQRPNPTLGIKFKFAVKQAELKYACNGRKACRVYASVSYQAATWSKKIRIICRVDVNSLGQIDTRYIVTSFEHASAKYLYDSMYCGRGGNAELYIKDHKTGLKSDRTSCHEATANQFRLFLHSAAYQIMHALRAKLLKKTELSSAQFETIRLCNAAVFLDK